MEPRLRLFVSLCLLGLGLVVGAKFLLPLVAPFLAGLVIACLIEPLVAWCERSCRLPRWLAASGVLAAVLMLVGLALATVAVNIWSGLRDLALGDQAKQMSLLLQELIRAGESGLRSLPAPLREAVLLALRELPARMTVALQQLLAGLGHLPGWLLLVFLSIMSAYFLCRDREVLSRFLLELTPREWRSRARGMKVELLRALMGFIRAQLLLVGLTFVLSTTGLFLIGARQPWLLGGLLGLLDFLPLIGPGAILLPWAGVSLVRGHWLQGLGLAGLFFVLAGLREMAEARLVGRNLGLHPLAALAAIYVGMRLFGLGGVLFGPLLLVILRGLHTALALPSPGRSTFAPPAGGVARSA